MKLFALNRGSIYFSFLASFLLISISACKKDTSELSLEFTDVKSDILSGLNALRSRGCYCGIDSMKPIKGVTWNNNLQNAAEDHAIDMYNKGYFDHVSPQGVTPGDRGKPGRV